MIRWFDVWSDVLRFSPHHHVMHRTFIAKVSGKNPVAPGSARLCGWGGASSTALSNSLAPLAGSGSGWGRMRRFRTTPNTPGAPRKDSSALTRARLPRAR